MSDQEPRLEMTDEDRRDFLKGLLGLGLAGGAAVGGWGALELLVPPGSADTWHKSVCRFCGTGCGIKVGLRDGKVADVRGDEDAHNKGVICIKGTMLRALPLLPGRLLKPKVRRGDRMVEASWDEAMGLAARTFEEIIRRDGPDAVAYYGSGQLYTEENYTANKLFKAGIRTNNVDNNARLCMTSAAFGYTTVFGKDEPSGSYADIDHADCFFLIGSNTFECHPPIFERIRRRRDAHPGTRLICVDPRRTRTAELSDYHLPVIPGADLLLLNSMAQVICEEGLHDRPFIEEHVRFSDEGGEKTLSFEDFRAFLDKDYRPEAVQDRLGVSADMIRRVAFLFARSKATMSLWTMGMNQRTQGTALNQMLSGLHLITGQICRPGATPLSLTGQCNACGGARDTGALAHALPGGRVVANPEHRREVEKLWGVPEGTISPNPGLAAVDLFRAMEADKVKAALIMCTNPAQSLPNAARYRKAMEKGFLVVAEAFEDSETAKLADVLLPAALWIEKEGVYGQTERRYQLVEKLLEPAGEARSDLRILVDLADRLGHGKLISARTPEAVWDEWRKMSASTKYNFEGITYDRLRKAHGMQWPCPTLDHPGTVRRYVGGDDPMVTPGKKVEFYGHHDHKAIVFLRPYVPSPEQATAEFPLILTSGRVLEMWHTGTITRQVRELARAAGPARFEINPADAHRLGVEDGDRVAVRSKFGEVQGSAMLSEAPRQGVLFAAFYDPALLINLAVADHYDPTSKEPEFKVTAVAVRKVTA
jgi:nitrate reductase NapA